MRTRFAPSPTGMLHVGGLRTALFAWLVAKKSGGTFTLRIEDTDRAREVPGAVEAIVRTLTNMGIAPQEGVMLKADGTMTEQGDYGPYFQSKRLSLYQEHLKTLLRGGHAYHCFCTPERLDEMRKKQQALRQAPMYDRTCIDLPADEVERRIASGEKYVIRMNIPREETITYDDAIYGTLSFKGHTIDDQVLMKSDGFPTYHLAHVVDDFLMKTDMVIRGEEWLSSLPKHLILFRALGWKPPMYAHVPLLLNPDRTKLSKRQGDVAAEEYLKKGYLPEALINFLALLGWNPGTEQEIFSLSELTETFSIERVQRSGAVFDLQKLEWLQGQWMRRISVEEFSKRIQPIVAAAYPSAAIDPAFLKRAALIQQRITFLAQAPEMMAYLYETPVPTMEIVANLKQKVSPDDIPNILDFLQSLLQGIPEQSWSQEMITKTMEDSIPTSGFRKGQVLWVLRSMLTGRAYSPGAYEVAALLTKEEALKRLTAELKA